MRVLRPGLGAALITALLLLPQLSAADPTADPAERAPLPGKGRRDFWDWLLEPHKAEVAQILEKARGNTTRVATPYGDGTVYDLGTGQYMPDRAQIRERLLSDAEGMLRYALKLAPGDVLIERELAVVLDENDRPAAQAALERYLADEVPERVTGEARVRLARWYARQRRFGDAIVQLRLALGSPGVDPKSRTIGLVLLASIYMHTGRLAEAIDLLEGSSTVMVFGGVDLLPAFALAVAYDRDEQVTLAHDTIQRIVGNNPEALWYVLFDFNGFRHPLVPAIERHYFAALQYEALGMIPEARTEWLAYARGDDAPFKERARQHVTDLDQLSHERMRAPKPKRAATTPAAPAPPPIPGWGP